MMGIKPSHLAYNQLHYDVDIPVKWYIMKKDQCKPNAQTHVESLSALATPTG